MTVLEYGKNLHINKIMRKLMKTLITRSVQKTKTRLKILNIKGFVKTDIKIK